MTSVVPGDFDGDHRLDFFVAGTNGFALLCRDSAGAWLALTPETGELYATMPTQSPTVVVNAVAADLNGDGRPGLAIFYPTGFPSLFFNRGFACFGLAREAGRLLPDETLAGTTALGAGQQTGTIIDLNDDGAPDLVAVGTDGTVRMLATQAIEPRRFRLTIALPAGAGSPRTVSVSQGKRSLGVFVLETIRPVTIALPKAGPVDLTWPRPDGSPATKRVVVAKPTTAELTDGP
jgi:hypothetical protein